MAFQTINFAHLAKFNSSDSSKLIEILDTGWKSKISAQASSPRHRTFAPSSYRCKRKCWFRLRGTQPSLVSKPDTSLDFSAEVGTACHKMIQTILKDSLGDDWLDVGEYLNSKFTCDGYQTESSDDGLETKISIVDPPVTFACDGLIRIDGKLYLLEIKTSEFTSFRDLTDVKPVHVDQIRCYSSLLGVPDVLVLYMDRQHGDVKCYQLRFTESEMASVIKDMKTIKHLADTNIPPDKLPTGDFWCQSCEYKKQCKEWG
jgi:CRISPR/Cas system-associated exonuclease Cas4 (RecB family)